MNSQPKEQSRAMVLWIYTCVEIYISPKLQSKGKGIVYKHYELFVPSINFTSPTNFNHKQWKRSWYIMGTIRARKNNKELIFFFGVNVKINEIILILLTMFFNVSFDF